MADIGKIPSCGGNNEQIFTGSGGCNRAEGKLMTLLITKKNAVFPSNSEDFNKGLTDWINTDDNDPQKMWVIKDCATESVGGGDPVTTDIGYGVMKATGKNPTSQIVKITKSGDCLAKQLAKFGGKDIRVFRVDDQNAVYGTVSKSATGSLDFKGYEASSMDTETLNDGQNAYTLKLNIYYTANYNNERKNRHAVISDNIPDGNSGVVLEKQNDGSFKVVDICSGDDYTVTYGSQWSVKSFVDKTGVNPSTVTFDSTAGTLKIEGTGTAYKVAGASILSDEFIYNIGGVNEFVNLA